MAQRWSFGQELGEDRTNAMGTTIAVAQTNVETTDPGQARVPVSAYGGMGAPVRLRG